MMALNLHINSAKRTIFYVNILRKQMTSITSTICTWSVPRYHHKIVIPTRGELVRIMVFNTTFNNISVLSRWSVLLVEETGVPQVNHRPVASHW